MDDDVRAIEGAVRLIRGCDSRPTMVAIDGMSASGKSTLARDLAAVLDDATVIPGDDFYRVMDDESRFRLSPREGYDRDFHWERLRDEVLRPLRRGDTADYRRYDWSTGELGGRVVVPPSSVVIVEGVYVSRPELRAAFDVVLWVDASAETRAARQALRDDPPSWVDRWDRAERHHVRSNDPAHSADLVISGEEGRR